MDLGIGQGEREDKFVLDAKAEMSARGDRRGEKKVEKAEDDDDEEEEEDEKSDEQEESVLIM